MFAISFQKEEPYNIGIQIDNINLSQPKYFNSTLIKGLIDLFDKHHLLIIRNQKLNETQLIQVSKIFGKAVQALVPTFRLEKYPLITKHTNKQDENGKPIGVVAPEYAFHSDSYFTTNPNKATLFYCLKAPACGGKTHFINMCAVYDSLDKNTKDFIADKKVLYRNAYINQPPVSHPLVRIHPITNQKALFVNIYRALGIEGLKKEESLPIIKGLYQHATLEKFIYKHAWLNGDLLIWNNPTTMHCATPISHSEERLLYRVLTEGDIPVT